jgi:hypothetical protein
MARNYSSNYTSIIVKYLDKYGEDMSNQKLAKKILRENEDIKLAPHSMRLAIGSVKKHYNPGISQACNDVGVSINDGKNVWLKNKEASVFATNPLWQKEEYNNFKAEIIDSIIGHEPNYPTIIRKPSDDGHLLVVDVADLHIGKLADAFETGEDYNNQIAVKRAKEGVQGILDKAIGFNIDKILFVGGNDILHVDTPRNTTTSGTGQDTSAMWYRNFLDAKKLYVELLEMLISFADVHFTFNPSNHDYQSGFFLSDCIMTHFRNCDNITFDCSLAHRKYILYGNSLIGTSHGDGAKQADLGSLMSIEAKSDWAKSDHRYFYIHHFHHKISKDYINVTVEALRSPSGTDSWHHRQGYTGAPKAVEGFIHNKEYGQICRLTHIFK